MDMITTSGIELAKYRNQFSIEMIGRLNANGTIFADLDKIFFINKIIPANASAIWNMIYENYCSDSRINRTRIGYTGLLEFPYGQELAISRIISLSSVSYLTGFYIKQITK
jgi:hypothetical protein